MSAWRNGLALAALAAVLCCAHADEHEPGEAPELSAAEAVLLIGRDEAADDSADNRPEFERGMASWYGPRFHGRRTANGEVYDMHGLTAAHPKLPFGSLVRVLNPDTGRSVDVRINDRGPHIRRRIIDLSRGAAKALGLLDAGDGIKHVVLKLLRPPPPLLP